MTRLVAVVVLLLGTSWRSALAQADYAPSTAQTSPSKGRWMLSLQSSDLWVVRRTQGLLNLNNPQPRVLPLLSYFITRQLVAGIGVPLDLTTRKGIYYSDGSLGPNRTYPTIRSLTKVGISPFVQYYLRQGRFRPYVGLVYSYVHQQLSFDIADLSVHLRQKGHQQAIGGFTGISYWLTPRLGVDALLEWSFPTGQHPYVTFPTYTTQSGYTDAQAYQGQKLTGNIGLRWLMGRRANQVAIQTDWKGDNRKMID